MAQLIPFGRWSIIETAFGKGVDFSDDRLLRTPVVINKLRRYIKELTPQQPDSLIKVSDALIRKVMPNKPYFQFFSNWIALQYENTKSAVMDGEAVYVHIVKNFFTPELAKWDTPENLEKATKTCVGNGSKSHGPAKDRMCVRRTSMV